MSPSSPLLMLKDVGSVADLWAVAQQESAAPRLKVNSHVHVPPNFSAFTSVGELIDQAAAQGVQVVGTSNYYDWSIYAPFARLAQARGIFPLFGLEVICMDGELRDAGIRVNDPGNPGKFYLCAKGLTQFEPMNETAQRLIDVIRRNDATRIAAMIAKVGAVFAAVDVPLRISEDTVKDMVRSRHGVPAASEVYLQERHIAQACQEALFARIPAGIREVVLARAFGTKSHTQADDAAAVQQEIRTHLMKAGKPGFVPETYVDFRHVHDLVLALGGIPCYTFVADGMQPMSEFEWPVDRLIEEVETRHFYCAELIPNRNTPEVVVRYTRALRAAGLIVLAGTEHNTLDMVPIEPTCRGGTNIPEDIKEILWEGACVVAAHQFLVAHGQTGFLDTRGQPNAAYANAETRICAFAALGAAVIHAFCRSTTGEA